MLTVLPDDNWRGALRSGARSIEALVARGFVDAADADRLAPVAERYQTLVSDYYLDLIDPDDPECPIRRQAIPDLRELDHRPLERADPIGDSAHSPTPLVVHRYPDRALFFPTFQCPMYCRYCFRKVALNDEPARLKRDLPKALAYFDAHPEIREIILSGGDPLMLADEKLAQLLKRLRGDGRRLRLHTRFPVTLPMRITPALARLLAEHRPLHLVTHFNHPRELTAEALRGLRLLTEAGITVSNQAVLLGGVNAEVSTLITLFEALLDAQVRPHYLHHPDLTVGTTHFRVSIAEGIALTRSLRGRMSGLAIPTYVLDIPGGGGKVPVDSGFVRAGDEPGRYEIQSPLGGVFTYLDPAA